MTLSILMILAGITWAAGAIPTYIWIVSGLIKTNQMKGYFDLKALQEDSGIWLVPVVWPLFWIQHPSLLIAQLRKGLTKC